MKNLTKFLKVLMINTIIFSLIQIPLASRAFAGPSSTGFDAKDILALANSSLGLYGNFLGQKQQMLQQQISAVNNQKLMSQLSPTCRKPDGTACFTTPAKYFPECSLPASMSNMPANACNNPSPEINQISSMITFESIAQGWMNYYDQMSNEASNLVAPIGLRCLEDKEKAMDTQLTEMVNNLQRLQDRLNQDKQIFRDNNKKLLEDMNTANDELFGASGKNNLQIKTQDFAKFFSPSCQSVIGKDKLNMGTSNGGLNGIVQGLSSTNKAAADFTLNKGAIEADAQREASRITGLINSSGIDDFLNNPNSKNDIKSNIFSSIEGTVNKQAAELNTARARINKELASLGYAPPPMDKNFSVDMQDFEAGSADFFKKKYVNDCVTGAAGGIAIPVEDILKSIQQKSTNNAGTARDDYRIALKKILDSDAMIDDKMANIKDLQAKFPDITVTYKDSSQSRVTESPYDLFMKTIDKCQQRFSQDDQFTSKGSNGVSYQKKVERGRADLQELKNLNDNFSSKITQAINEKILNCNGEASKSGSEFCNEDSLKSSNDNFCVAHAASCANDIQGCFAEANTQVQTRKTKMENLAKVFNANVAAMTASANAMFEQQKAAVTNITKIVQARFPGTNFEIPKDMFVTMPELSKDAYGVEMAGNGDIKSFLDGENSMPAKIDKLKLVFQKQKDAVKKSIDEYIGLQKASMDKEKGRWNELFGQCKGAVDTSSRALAKMNEDGQKRQAEQDGQTAEFCNRFASLAENPAGACDEASELATDMKKASQRLDPSVGGNVNAFKQFCNQVQNESENGTSASSDRKNKKAAKKTAGLKSLCVNDGKVNTDDDAFISALKRSNPLAKKFITADVKDYVTGVSSTAPTIENDDVAALVDQLKADYDAGAGKKSADVTSKFKSTGDEVAAYGLDKKSICSSLIFDQLSSVSGDSKFKDLNAAAMASSKFVTDDGSIAMLSDLVASNAGSIEDKATALGEKLSGAPCDMQNKSNITKNTGFDLQSFDASVVSGAAR